MELSVRMQMNADLVPEERRVGDVGCDHGYVSIYLAREKKCRKIIAMDVKEGPLAIARKNIEREGLAEQIQCRLSDGLTGLKPGEVDTVLMAGMGGMLICHILQKSPRVLEQISCLVLQPQSDWEQVRRLVCEKGFAIETESFCFDSGKPYLALRAVRDREQTSTSYSDAEYRYGRFLAQKGDSDYNSYLQSEKEKILHIIEQLEKVSTETYNTRIQELMYALQCIDEVRNYK